MTVRQALPVAAALLLALGGAACGDREGAPLGAETDEPLYVQGKQLEKQGRNPEALSAFLKLIDRRGERAAPESHLEAGLICLNHTKDPVEAYHHFRKYLELQPNSKETPFVRGMVDAARREFARTLSARPLEDQSVRLETAEELANLRRERDELRAEIAALRGAAPVQPRTTLISVPDLNARAVAPPVAKVVDSPIVPAPAAASPVRPTAAPGTALRSAPSSATVPPSTAGVAARTASKAGGRTHTIVAGDTFFNLSKKFGVRMEDLAAANAMTIKSPLRVGAVLKIP